MSSKYLDKKEVQDCLAYIKSQLTEEQNVGLIAFSNQVVLGHLDAKEDGLAMIFETALKTIAKAPTDSSTAKRVIHQVVGVAEDALKASGSQS